MHADGIWLTALSGLRVYRAQFAWRGLRGEDLPECFGARIAQGGAGRRSARALTVIYDEVVAGQYYVDLMVEQALSGHRAQCVNYLKASGPAVCLNFGKSRLEIKQVPHGP